MKLFFWDFRVANLLQIKFRKTFLNVFQAFFSISRPQFANASRNVYDHQIDFVVHFQFPLHSSLYEPVRRHAVSRPLSLTDPAPAEPAPARHVHAAAVAFGRNAAHGARLRQQADGTDRGDLVGVTVASSSTRPRGHPGTLSQDVGGYCRRREAAGLDAWYVSSTGPRLNWEMDENIVQDLHWSWVYDYLSYA
jgi:hypothetical protein